jgi:hypothetical protein
MWVPEVFISLDLLRSTWLGSDLQQVLIWSSCHFLATDTQNWFPACEYASLGAMVGKLECKFWLHGSLMCIIISHCTWVIKVILKWLMYFPPHLTFRNFTFCLQNIGSQDSVVCIVTLNGLDGPEFEPWWGRDFLDPSRLVLKSTQPPVKWVLGLFSWGKAARAWHWPSTLL